MKSILKKEKTESRGRRKGDRNVTTVAMCLGAEWHHRERRDEKRQRNTYVLSLDASRPQAETPREGKLPRLS